MEYTRLGESGLKISKIIMGCMVFGNSKWEGSPWTLDEEEGLQLLKKAYDLGINTWDTADFYSNGASEVIVGKALKKYNISRNKVTILSKVYFPITEGEGIRVAPINDGAIVNQMGLSRKHIFDAVDGCLRRLDMDYIDVLQIHRLDRDTPPEEIMKALHDVVMSGKVRYIGASSMWTWEFAQLQHIAELKGWTKFISMQNFYNLVYREEEREMIPFCKATGVGIIPWSPMARGLLTRPWGTAESERARGDKYSAVWNVGASSEVVGRVEQLAKKKGVSMAVLATAWVLHKGCSPILGLNKPERIEEAVGALQVRFAEDEVKFLEEEYKPRAVQGH
ncbi:NADP-dependent oxidoreductase domain-containing protein [Ilyonectria robusta]|uniref:NADP-dependent oxidoreductase domain-containing protein n=1 Tax=Ilyonectria robusta TaxID=1079257 RepID=UPI001E8E1108|nr:NADP-dependent oxidoreductase domain-containing protein [Ilyonectria robusta]KAH8735345.1 NADP-dependent oxidoreductase domain-containing protein [Ilyonectria robusta]